MLRTSMLAACVIISADAIAVGLPGRVRTFSTPSVRLIDLLPARWLVPASPFALSAAFGCGFGGGRATTSNHASATSRTRRPVMLISDESLSSADIFMLAVANAFSRACAGGSQVEGCQWVGLETSLADVGRTDSEASEEETHVTQKWVALFLERGAFSEEAALAALEFRQLYRSAQP